MSLLYFRGQSRGCRKTPFRGGSAASGTHICAACRSERVSSLPVPPMNTKKGAVSPDTVDIWYSRAVCMPASAQGWRASSRATAWRGTTCHVPAWTILPGVFQRSVTCTLLLRQHLSPQQFYPSPLPLLLRQYHCPPHILPAAIYQTGPQVSSARCLLNSCASPER